MEWVPHYHDVYGRAVLPLELGAFYLMDRGHLECARR
jgi:hypothetical protein